MMQTIAQTLALDEIFSAYDKEIYLIIGEQKSVLELNPGVGRNTTTALIRDYNNFQSFPDAC